MILVIDNYDSFVFNIARALVELGRTVQVVRNDRLSVDDAAALRPAAVILSPGPSRPEQAGISLDLVRRLSGRVPILGVCLGHQCIGQAFGGQVLRARRPLHGQASPVRHDGSRLFSGLANPLVVGRYHSLAVALPEAGPLRPTAWSEEGEIMGLEHHSHPTFGVQFHPESVLTPEGQAVLGNFVGLVR